MKALFLGMLGFAAIAPAMAQDLIVTTEGDSINCKITKEKDGFVYFLYSRDGSIESTVLKSDAIRSHARDYFSYSEVPDATAQRRVFRPWRMALQGGYSYQTGKLDPSVPADFKDYTNELRSGFHLGLDAARYFNDVLGVGLKVSLLRQANEENEVWIDDGSGQRYGRMSDDITTLFVAPTFANRYLSSDKKHAFIMNVSLGYLNYTNKAVLVDPVVMKGGTVGAAIDVGYDIAVSNNFQLGLQLSYTGGALSRYTINGQQIELEQESRLGLNRIDVSVGLRLVK